MESNAPEINESTECVARLRNEALNNKRWEAAYKLLDAMDDRNLSFLETTCGTVRKLNVESNVGSEPVLSFNGSGDLLSKIGAEGDFFYSHGDFNARIEKPSPSQVINFLESWESFIEALHRHDNRVAAAASTELRDIPEACE